MIILRKRQNCHPGDRSNIYCSKKFIFGTKKYKLFSVLAKNTMLILWKGQKCHLKVTGAISLEEFKLKLYFCIKN